MLKDVLEILATTPEKIRREIASMRPPELKRRPVPHKWSVEEILAHLADVEEVAMRARVVGMVEQDKPVLPAIDQEARVVEIQYCNKDPRRTLAAFTRQRKANVKWLRQLRLAQLKRKGLHETVGEVSVEELLHEWAFHDLGHLKQIMEVKRYAPYPRTGNMEAFYQLN